MGYGMSFGTGLPSNYQNALYWQYLMQSMQQAQEMQQQRYDNAVAMLNARNAQQQMQAVAQTQTVADSASMDAPVDSLSSSQVYTQNQSALSADGKDDGKISAGKKFKNFFKGVGNFFKGMVCDEKGKFSLTQTLKTAAIAAGAVVLTVATGGAAAPFLIAGGAALGAYQTGKGVYKAVTAKTDAEAEAAWQEIGSGTTAVFGSVAGAKGALKAAGAPIPKGNAVTSSLHAAKDCVKIAGKGVFKGGRAAIMHPMQSARAARAYYNNTVKPNMAEAFSFKNGYKNYTAAMEEKINARIQEVETQIKSLSDELIHCKDATKRAQITTKIAELKAQNQMLNTELGVNNINDPKAVKNGLNILEENLKTLKEQRKLPTQSQKMNLDYEIKLKESLIKNIKAQLKIKEANYNVQKAAAQLKQLEADLKIAQTDAQKAAINKAILKTENILNQNKTILRNSNMKIAAQKTLPDVGIAAGTYYLANPSAQVDGLDVDGAMSEAAMLAEADAYAQSQGFESAAAMQAYLDNQIKKNESEIAKYNQTQNASQAQASQYATNPYGYNYMNMYSQIPLPAMNMNSGLDFNSLYMSPYPQFYF